MNKILLYLFVFLLPLVTIAADDERAYDERIHVVQPKETLYRLSRQYGVSMASIKQANKLTSDIISAAARLTIKLPKENDYFQVHIVRVSENLEGISEKYMMPFDILTKYNDLDDNVIFPGQRIFIKIDKIATKYTYKGEEDMPVTDAEMGDVNGNPQAGVGNYPSSAQDNSATAGTNTAPTFVYSPNLLASLRDSLPKGDKAFTIEGSLDAYYGWMSDQNQNGATGQFALNSPKHNQTGINTAQLSGIYSDSNIRGNVTLQWGDLPAMAYPSEFRWLQQANVGFRIGGRWWADAGFFRSPVSVEDFPARNNAGSIYAYSRYFEPVLFSGARLGWEGKSVKISAFASDRSFYPTATNSNFSYGLNIKVYTGKNWLLGFNAVQSKVYTPVGTRPRTYGNVFISMDKKHFTLLAYANYGTQDKAGKDTATGHFFSTVLNLKFKLSEKFAFYTRGEYFMDSSAVISPLMSATDGIQQGFSATAISAGFEFKARKNHYLRLEARNTQLPKNFKIYNDYLTNGPMTNQRWEFVVTTGIWFGK